MNLNRNWKLAAAGVAALAAAGAGGAFAATKLLSPSERSQAVIADAANQLGVQPAALTKALKTALEKQVDADVKAGRMTKERLRDVVNGERPELRRPFFRSHDRDFRLPATPPPDLGRAPA